MRSIACTLIPWLAGLLLLPLASADKAPVGALPLPALKTLPLPPKAGPGPDKAASATGRTGKVSPPARLEKRGRGIPRLPPAGVPGKPAAKPFPRKHLTMPPLPPARSSKWRQPALSLPARPLKPLGVPAAKTDEPAPKSGLRLPQLPPSRRGTASIPAPPKLPGMPLPRSPVKLPGLVTTPLLPATETARDESSEDAPAAEDSPRVEPRGGFRIIEDLPGDPEEEEVVEHRLQVQATLDQAIATPGSEITLRIQVRNTGTQPHPANELQILFQPAPLTTPPHRLPLPALTPGEERTLTFSAALPPTPGEYCARVMVDALEETALACIDAGLPPALPDGGGDPARVRLLLHAFERPPYELGRATPLLVMLQRVSGSFSGTVPLELARSGLIGPPLPTARTEVRLSGTGPWMVRVPVTVGALNRDCLVARIPSLPSGLVVEGGWPSLCLPVSLPDILPWAVEIRFATPGPVDPDQPVPIEVQVRNPTEAPLPAGRLLLASAEALRGLALGGEAARETVSLDLPALAPGASHTTRTTFTFRRGGERCLRAMQRDVLMAVAHGACIRVRGEAPTPDGESGPPGMQELHPLRR